MVAKVTDWETEAHATSERFCEQIEVAFRDLKSVRAINLRFVKTGANTAHSMTMRPDEETASFAIEAMEAVGSSLIGV